MGRLQFVPIAAVVLGLLLVSFIAFPSFPGTGFLSFTPSVAVDRALKGDRLPLSAPTDKTEMRVPSAPSLREKIPVGCDLQPGLFAAAGQCVPALRRVTEIGAI
jgi:hypothetical protein